MIPLDVLTDRELLTYQVDVKGQIFRQIHARLADLKALGVHQKDIAARLRMDEGQLSRCLKGQNDLRVETLSDLARAMDCRIAAQLEPITYVSNTIQVAIEPEAEDGDIPTVEGGTDSFNHVRKAA